MLSKRKASKQQHQELTPLYQEQKSEEKEIQKKASQFTETGKEIWV